MNITPVTSFSKTAYKPNSKVAFGNAPDTTSPTYDVSKLERSAEAKFDPEKGVLTIHTAIKNTFDSDSWYSIKEDGSGQYSTCWHPKVAQYDKGALKDIYEEAKALCEKNNGKISDEDAKVLMEKIKQRPY